MDFAYHADVRVVLRNLLVAMAMTASLPVARAQNPGEQAPEPQTEKFSGTVAELSAEKLTVVRNTAGAKAERRTFLIRPETRVEGKLHVKARVTVGFVATADGDVAHLIVVRQPQAKKT
ncbi:MAG: hypothetical protein ABSF98_27540 [Bryobacteraceae bacterium]|jgi:hypothetical protein